MTPQRGQIPVSVGIATAPDGSRMVLLQLPDGHVLMGPRDAISVAHMLAVAAVEVMEEGGLPPSTGL
jgi:hypothetical protein